MFISFFESIKYAGHLVPISFLRIFMGYYYLQQSLTKFHGDFLTRPKIAAAVAEWLPLSHAPEWYKNFLEIFFIPNWQIFAFVILALQFAIAISYIFGYLVRPMAVIAAIICFNAVLMGVPGQEDLFKTLIAIHLVLAWLGAGRCLGFDYYFYKRERGIWW